MAMHQTTISTNLRLHFNGVFLELTFLLNNQYVFKITEKRKCMF